MKHIVCYSGGHSSALVAVETARKFENVVLLNHDIKPTVESADIKRFKNEVANKLDLDIEYANHSQWEEKDQFDICTDLGSWINSHTRQMLCTTKLKTEPFKLWLLENYEKGDKVYYGFDSNETHRIQRRIGIMDAGYLHDSKKVGVKYTTDYPIALWDDRTIQHINELEINPPCQYQSFKHANCIGCLKAGWQHWFIVFNQRKDIWNKAKEAESDIGYSIHSDAFLKDKEQLFEDMVAANVPQTEHINHNRFWAEAKKAISHSKAGQNDLFDMEVESQKPCDCIF